MTSTRSARQEPTLRGYSQTLARRVSRCSRGHPQAGRSRRSARSSRLRSTVDPAWLGRRSDARWRSAFPLLNPEAEEEHPDREHRGEHTEDDAGCHEIGASQSVHEQPQAAEEDQSGAELTEEEPSEAVA